MKVYVIAMHADSPAEKFLVKMKPYTFDAVWSPDVCQARKYVNRRNANHSWVSIKKKYPNEEITVLEISFAVAELS